MSVSGSSRGRKSQKTCETISVDELGSLLTEGTAQHVRVIDVREFDAYSGFIPSSYHVPFDTFDSCLEELCQEFARSRKLIVFHDMSPEDFRAVRCAKLFEERLFDLFPSSPSCVCVLKGGFEAWKSAYGWKPDAGQYISMEFSLDWDDIEHSSPVTPRLLDKQRFESNSSAADLEEPQSSQLFNAAQRSARAFIEQMFYQDRSFDTRSASGSDRDATSSTPGAAKAKQRLKSVGFAEHQEGYAQACADGTLPQPAPASTDITVGSLLQIYSNSQAKWIPARVVATSSGRVKALYQASETSFMTKVLPRQSGSLRPLERCNSEEARILMNMNILTMSSMVELEYISQEELVACFQRPDIQLIDVREEHEYFTGHILGARHCPHHRFDKELRGLAHEFAYSDKTLVFYGCDSEDFAFDCARRCLAHLRSRFFRRTCEVRALLGGFEDWLASCKHPGLRSMRVSLGRDRPHTCSPFSTEESLANWSDILRATRTDQSLPNLIDDNEGEDELDDERTPDVQKRNKHAFSFVPKARNR
eukprot:gnl/TRDRNA2_/TRDRNA2_176897_c1_seq3.p1 gnl/TRDRNA2_/TRDRNA2_176897_c1~~gnl/TRDRNA2_/TRDRNA2_176897_c1_seq3.p1  ORF type:complete len:534 (+),score=60.51 gnl/TRDRNA2_/TRDRNA2_176897_c1_seq3:109-1710(+)